MKVKLLPDREVAEEQALRDNLLESARSLYRYNYGAGPLIVFVGRRQFEQLVEIRGDWVTRLHRVDTYHVAQKRVFKRWKTSRFNGRILIHFPTVYGALAVGALPK